MKHTIILLAASLWANTLVFGQNFQPAPMFGTSGAKSVEILAGEDRLIRGQLLPDGKYLAAGGGFDNGCNCSHISLLKMDTLCGALDPTFGNGGAIGLIFDQRSSLFDMAVMSDGRILACGENAPNNYVSMQVGSVYRLNANGTPDLTMNGSGWRNDRFDAVSSGYNTAVFPLLGDRFCTVGMSYWNGNGGALGFGIMRYDAAGAFDLNYSGDGLVWYPAADLRSAETALFLPDSSIIAIHGFGPGTTTLHMAKFLSDGTLDPAFGNGGQMLSSVTFENNPYRRLRAALAPDGRFLIGGTTADALEQWVARFMPDGSLDTSYGTSGISLCNPTTGADYGLGLQLMDDGSTLQFGYSTTNVSLVVKRTPAGQLDAGFGTNGVLTIPALVSEMNINGGTMINDGSILVHGVGVWPAWSALIVKLTTDPSAGLFADLGPDTGFCPGSTVVLDAGSPGSTYQWNMSFQNLGTTQTITASSGGAYNVTITDAQGCTDRDTINVTAWLAPLTPQIFGDAFELFTSALPEIQWYLNGEPIPGANEEIWIPQQNGTYTVTETAPNGCSSTSAPFDVLNVGIVEPGHSNLAIQVAPVPISEASVVTFRTTRSEKASMHLHDATGRVVLTVFADRYMPAGMQRLTLDKLPDLAPGKYFLSLTSNSGRYTVPVVR